MATLSALKNSAPRPRCLPLQVDLYTPQGFRTVNALLDCEALFNLISQKIIIETGLTPLPNSTELESFTGHELVIYGEHLIETHAVDMRNINGYTAQTYLATNVPTYDLLLGYPWLETVNPNIDWDKRTWCYSDVKVEGAEELSAEEFTQLALTEKNVRIAYITPADPQVKTETCFFVGLVSKTSASVQKEIKKFTDVFSEEGAASLPRDARVQHRIEIEPGKQVPYGPIYALSQNELRILREYLETSMANGRIRPSLSPAGAPILFVPKSDGTLRLCVDYRGLNKITVKNRYPLPLLSEILDRLGGACVYTKLDLRDAYHRIPIAKDDIWKTAFRTRYGHFEYTVMPFGLTNAPATFQAYINDALKGLLDNICIAYMDDILIYSRSEKEHAAHVRAVLERLREYGLYVKLSKCQFAVKEVGFLGFRVGVAGVSMDPSRVQAIQDWPKPESFRDIQVFLGFANFYRGFIQSYSKVVAPITDLLVGMRGGRKTGKFEWTISAEQAFHKLKACFMSAPLLQHYDPEKQARVETDASKQAAGGVLSQAYETPTGRTLWKPVAFFSKKFTKEQRNYSTGDQEMLAIVMAFKEWRHYLDAPAYRTIVLSDHEALQSFMTTKSLQGRQIRWAEYLSAFNFEIRYRKGKENPADGLSRRPDHKEEDEAEEHPLKGLILLRTRDQSGSHVQSTAHYSKATVGLLTRGMARNAQEASRMKILPIGEDGMRVSGETHELIPIDDVVVGRPPCEATEASEQGQGPTTGEEAAAENFISRIPTSLENLLLHLQSNDEWCKREAWKKHASSKVSKCKFKGLWSQDKQGLVRYDGAVYVPNDPATRAELMRVNHDDPWQGGHFGRERTCELIKRFYYWPHMRQEINDYVKSCEVCQRMKVPRHKPYGLLAPLPKPEKPWQDISLDFIVGLPPSVRMGVVYDAILVVVDRFSKMVRYIPTTKDVDAPGVGILITDHILSKFGVPKSIVSDRGSIFTSSFWESLCFYLATRRCLSTAFHPQTDGQTERMNQTLECYLRCFINYEQDDWVELLPCAEYASNQAVNATTGKSPFEMVFKFTPNLQINVERETPANSMLHENEVAKGKATGLEQAQRASKEARTTAETAVEKHFNKKRKDMHFIAGDLVRLSTKHIRTLRAHKKLAERFIGPFKVLERVGANAYKLELPKKYNRLHHTFHVSLLENYHVRDGCEPPEPQDIDGVEEWEIERILDERIHHKKTQFYVRWKGFSEANDSWEPEEHLEHAQEAINEFRDRKKGTKV